MAVLDDNDPIVQLCDQFAIHFKGHTHATIMAALAASLGALLEIYVRKHGLPHPDVAILQDTLKQLAAEVLASRHSPAQRES